MDSEASEAEVELLSGLEGESAGGLGVDLAVGLEVDSAVDMEVGMAPDMEVEVTSLAVMEGILDMAVEVQAQVAAVVATVRTIATASIMELEIPIMERLT